MNLPSRRPLLKHKNKRKILVISWWWARWTYALWIMKALEELWIDKQLDAIYWVSIWAIIWSVRLSWLRAEQIFEIITNLSITDFYWRELLKKSWWLVSNKKIKLLLEKYLPSSFEELRIPFYAWCVDTNTAEYKLFNKWNLRKIILWSMAIPGIFPAVKYWEYSLIDWWVLNNFPADLAKQHYPKHEIIWIALNKFQTNQKIKSSLDNLQITLEVIMRSKLLENTKIVNYLFYKDLPIPVLSLNKKQMHEAFISWYQDWIKMFKNPINSKK